MWTFVSLDLVTSVLPSASCVTHGRLVCFWISNRARSLSLTMPDAYSRPVYLNYRNPPEHLVSLTKATLVFFVDRLPSRCPLKSATQICINLPLKLILCPFPFFHCFNTRRLSFSIIFLRNEDKWVSYGEGFPLHPPPPPPPCLLPSRSRELSTI